MIATKVLKGRPSCRAASSADTRLCVDEPGQRVAGDANRRRLRDRISRVIIALYLMPGWRNW